MSDIQERTRASSTLMGLLSTLFDRRHFRRTIQDERPITELCLDLLSAKSDSSSMQLATAILSKYAAFSDDEKAAFFNFLNEQLDIEGSEVALLAQAYVDDTSPQNFQALCNAAESKRREVFRRLNEAPSATAELVRMRADLLRFIKSDPSLKRTDVDLSHLLRSWFNRGFLVLRLINWDSAASILERLIHYEAVHEIRTWDDLRGRLQPSDRRCFAFFHPAMPDDPLIFVVVALTKGVPDSIQEVLADNRQIYAEHEVDTAVFYSISNCQDGLAGISFGDSLIKQVVKDLSHELPSLKTFVTLSPIPGFVRWLDANGLKDMAVDAESTRQLAAHYLVDQKNSRNAPLDPVARFHLGNGALVHDVHANADTSDNGMKQSLGTMVNYLYDLPRISRNLQAFATRGEAASSSTVLNLAKAAAKSIASREPIMEPSDEAK